jgi:Crp-like helix-turn-helix domain
VNVELVADCARVRVPGGTTCRHDVVRRAVLLVVADGLLVLRTAIPGTKRRTVTCHAGPGAVVLPPAEDEALVAVSDCVIHCISADDRTRLLRDPETATALLDAFGDTLRQKHVSIANMARLHHVDRVRLKLIELARDHGRVGKDGVRLDFPLTHDLLGEMTGSARETVTRALDELQREGFIARRGRTYSLQVEPEQLSVTTLTLRH